MPSCVVKGCKNNSQKQKRSDGLSFHRFPLEPDIRNEWIVIVRKNRQDAGWRPSKFCIICSEHFADEDMYFTKQGRRCIKKEAKPTLRLLNYSGKAPHFATVEVTSVIEDEKEDGKNITLKNYGIKKEDSCEDGDADCSENMPIEFVSDKRSIKKKNIKQEAVKKRHIKEETGEELKSFSASKETGPNPRKSPRESKQRKIDSEYENSDSELDNSCDNREVGILKRKLIKEQMLRASAKKKLKILQQKVRRLTRRNSMLKRIVLKLKYNKSIENDENELKDIKMLNNQDDSNSE